MEEVTRLKEDCCLNSVDISGETPLFKASYRGHLKVVRALLERGADSTIQSGNSYAFDFIKPGIAKSISYIVVELILDSILFISSRDLF